MNQSTNPMFNNEMIIANQTMMEGLGVRAENQSVQMSYLDESHEDLDQLLDYSENINNNTITLG